MSLQFATRHISMEVVSRLRLEDKRNYPMPGAWRKRGALDPRLPHLNSLNTKNSDDISLAEHMATVSLDGRYFIIYRETMDALLGRQADLVRFPEWLMKSTVKKTELKIYIGQVLHQPASRDDTNWITPSIDNDQLFDSICYYLLAKGILTEEMYGREK